MAGHARTGSVHVKSASASAGAVSKKISVGSAGRTAAEESVRAGSTAGEAGVAVSSDEV